MLGDSWNSWSVLERLGASWGLLEPLGAFIPCRPFEHSTSAPNCAFSYGFCSIFALAADPGPSVAILGRSLVRLRRCWADLGPISGDRDLSWSIFGDVGPTLGPSSALVDRSWADIWRIFGDLGTIGGSSAAIFGQYWVIFGILGPILV